MEVKSQKDTSILVVDDSQTIRHILERYLKAKGYSVLLAESGEKAVRLARESVPDLVLLDIMMPVMDGFEVCEQLKAHPVTQDIPVLFITTLDDVGSHRKAIECGGQGFITKPFCEDLLNAYVEILLEKKIALDDIVSKAKWQTQFMKMGIHDVNNLLLAVCSNLELALFDREAKREIEKRIDRSLSILRSATDMVRNFHDVLRLGSSKFQLKEDVIDMKELLERTISIFDAEMQGKGLGFMFRGPRTCKVRADLDLVERIVMNLLGNAVKFANAGTDLCFSIEGKQYSKGGGLMEFLLTNQCTPLPPEYQYKIFDMFTQGPQIKVRRKGTGIGLAFCKAAIEKHGGKIWIESPLKGQDQGFGVHFTLPGVSNWQGRPK